MLFVLGLSLVLILVAGGCLLLTRLASGLFEALSGTGTPSTTLPQDLVATLPSPLARVEFPEENTEYPVDWPPAYRYPESMRLVELASGSVLAGDAAGWTMKHRFSGEAEEAARLVESWFVENGWQVVERLSLDSGGSVLLVEWRDGGSGIITIDSDPSRLGDSLIASTFLGP
jgi:hypothetical protein